MPDTTTAPYGSWESPLSAADVASTSKYVAEICIDKGSPYRVYWTESRPSEGGRRTLFRQETTDFDGATIREVTPNTQWNVRSRVHEYGGSPYAVYDGLILFCNASDCGLYLFDANSALAPRRIAQQDDKLWYANMVIHPSKKFAVAVREDHRNGDIDALAALVAIPLPSDLDADEFKPIDDVVLFSQSDFVSSPVFSPLNDEIAFYTWNHPNMNWDATTLHRATLSFDANGVANGFDNLAIVAGGEGDIQESIYQPRFDDAGRLHFLADRSGFWNPYYVDSDGKTNQSLAEPMKVDFAVAEWEFGFSTFQPVPGKPDEVVVRYIAGGRARLYQLNVVTHEMTELPTPEWSVMDAFHFGVDPKSGSQILMMLGGGPKSIVSLFTYFMSDAPDAKQLVFGAANITMLSDGDISIPSEIEFPTRLPPFDNDRIGQGGSDATAFVYFYPPTNKNFAGPAGELPPLLVLSHGGPTFQADPIYNSQIQFWTTRGFAVADVNYGGSTGKGRAYRERLYPWFGIVDVQDCCAAALYLAETGKVDRQRLTIMGESAGGFCTLAALTFRPEVFAAGASICGMSDLELFAQETHKFEAYYIDRPVGPYPEARDRIAARSPINSVDKLVRPTVFFHGADDKIVPPNQAAVLAEALKDKGVMVAHVEIPGEGHGFRKAENIVLALEGQLYFFGKVLGFTPAGHIQSIEIFNEK
ncbi:hypothetical protein EC988_001538 [Linderina pennispora]|nr:hypothetical protein EC988_001538 [Linderina pennispora]